MAKQAKRLATDYLQVGQMVSVPNHIPAPIVYTADAPSGKTVRTGVVVELLKSGAVAVDLGGKKWDYSNKEALQFSRVY